MEGKLWTAPKDWNLERSTGPESREPRLDRLSEFSRRLACARAKGDGCPGAPLVLGPAKHEGLQTYSQRLPDLAHGPAKKAHLPRRSCREASVAARRLWAPLA